MSVREEVFSALQDSPKKSGGGKASKKRKAESSVDTVEVIVAAQQDNILTTAFHPELTEDPRWHVYFTRMVEKYVEDQTK